MRTPKPTRRPPIAVGKDIVVGRQAEPARLRGERGTVVRRHRDEYRVNLHSMPGVGPFTFTRGELTVAR